MKTLKMFLFKYAGLERLENKNEIVLKRRKKFVSLVSSFPPFGRSSFSAFLEPVSSLRFAEFSAPISTI